MDASGKRSKGYEMYVTTIYHPVICIAYAKHRKEKATNEKERVPSCYKIYLSFSQPNILI